ncbi:MAG: hypothetical protein Q9209_003689 [Squamulea sp. 1 TL-2023]
MNPKTVTDSQLHALEVTEKVASVLSLIAASFIILTFVSSSAFRRPVNRLIFYASWGNLLANAATLISRSGVKAGSNAALCQFQAFLIQMFFIADVLWNLAMAINVYLTIFKKYNSEQLKAIEWRYHLLCYGTPFIIALIFCFIDTQGRGKMYGEAQLWCWISPVSFTLYVMSGREMLRKRQELRSLVQPSASSTDDTLFKTTEINVTSEAAGFSMPKAPADCFDLEDRHHHLTGSSKDYEPYSTTINAPSSSLDSDPSGRHSSHATSAIKRYKTALEDNTAAMKYIKVALLFFTSLCVTWLPSSINRIYDLAHPNNVSYALNFISAIVLPLMGFWNGVIYVATTRKICAAIFWDLLERWAPKKRRAKRSSRTARSSNESRSVRTSWFETDNSMTAGLVPMTKESSGSDAV